MTTDSLGLELCPESPHKKSSIEVSLKLVRRVNVVSHTRAQIKTQLSPAWPRTIWPQNQVLKQIIFSYGTFNPLLFYSLAVPQIYCGFGGLAVSHLSHFPECNTHTHTHTSGPNQGEGENAY